ncbi:MAG: DHHA1 domain-containing protein [Lachnospiraceae bacterium]|nr:DHHA1 domain-containing protein [Lachnospiraceae bacterium]
MDWKKLLNILRGHRVFIQTHNFPDPDAIACAFGMQKFLKYHGIETIICYNGSVDKISVIRMLDNFKIQMFPYDELDIDEKDYVLLVDGQKYSANLTDIPGDEVACIDHHPTVKPCDYLYQDIRMVGACASMVAEYFYESKTPIDEKTASALMYGIRMDTASFGRGVKLLDIQMFEYLFQYAKVPLVDRMVNDNIELADLRAYGAAIENIQIYGYTGIAYIPFDCEDALIAMISDFILRLDTVTVSVVYAEKNGGLKFSVRSEEENVHAGNLIHSALEGYGDGGGHSAMAGGYIPGASRTTEKAAENKLICQRFIDALKKFHTPVDEIGAVCYIKQV